MATKTLGHRLFGWGRLPTRARQQLDAEGLLVRDEGVPLRVTYRNYRAPGRRYGFKRSSGSGSIAITKKRLVVFLHRWPILDLPTDHPAWSQLDVSLPESNVLRITFEANALDARRSGQVAIQLRSARCVDLHHTLAFCGKGLACETNLASLGT